MSKCEGCKCELNDDNIVSLADVDVCLNCANELIGKQKEKNAVRAILKRAEETGWKETP